MMQHSDTTISVSTITDAYHTLLESGVSESAINTAICLDAVDISNPDARIPSTCLPLIWDFLIKHTGKPDIGLIVGTEVKLERLSIIAQAFMQSKSVRLGIEQYIRFHRLVNESVCVSLSIPEANSKHKLAQLDFKFDESSWHRSEAERTIVSAVARARAVTRLQIDIHEVHFEHPAPDYSLAYETHFGCPVKFSRGSNSMFFDAALLEIQPKNPNPYLFSVLVNHAEKLMSKLKKQDNIIERTSAFIQKEIGNENLDVELAAKRLNMSRHTLYRKLKARDTTFQLLVDDVKKRSAIELLSDANTPISDVAFVTGFSELSAFSRAFKRWTGESPAHYRKRLHAD